MSPAQIEILLWYHTRAIDYEGELGQKYVDEQTYHFVTEELLSCELTRKPVYKITDKGAYYVTHGLCAVPLPVQTFTIPVSG